MEKCPKCEGTYFSSMDKAIGGSAHSVKVISCTKCHTIVGTTISDQLQNMIADIHSKINRY